VKNILFSRFLKLIYNSLEKFRHAITEIKVIFRFPAKFYSSVPNFTCMRPKLCKQAPYEVKKVNILPKMHSNCRGSCPLGSNGLSTMVCNNENDAAIVGGGFGALYPPVGRTILHLEKLKWSS
jgi:hypothetical protein